MPLFKPFQPLVSESLGRDRSVELDPTTGGITILDERAGVQLTALQVLVLTGFLAEHEQTIASKAYAALAQREE